MESFVYNLIGQINHFPSWSVFLGAFVSGVIQVAFPPYPGELVLALCGCISSDRDIFHSLLLFFTYWVAIISANIALYTLGACKGDKLLDNRFISRFIAREGIEKIRQWLSKYGLLVFLTAIYIPGMYLPVVFFSGVLKYRKKYTIAGMMIATLIHDSLIFFGGRFLGGNLRQVTSFIETYRDISLTAVFSLISIYVTYRIVVYIKRKLQKQGNIDFLGIPDKPSRPGHKKPLNP